MIATEVRQGAGAGVRSLVPVGSVALAALGIVLGFAAWRASQAVGGLTALADGPVPAALVLGAAVALVVAGAVASREDRAGWRAIALSVTGVLWLVPDLAVPTVGSAVLFTAGLSLAWLWPIPMVVVVLPRGDWTRPLVLSGIAVLGVCVGILPSMLFDPAAAGCGDCPTNLLRIVEEPAIASTVTLVAASVGAIWALVATVVVAAELLRTSRAQRAARGLEAGSAVIALSLFAVALLQTAMGSSTPTDPLSHSLRTTASAALLGIVAGVAAGWLFAIRTRTRVARLVGDLAAAPRLGGLQDQLAGVLNDPDLRLRYVTGSERVAEPPVGSARVVTPIVRDGEVVATLEHAESVLREPAELHAVVRVARLGLEYERLQAEATAQVEALRTARRRIVATADEHRRRLERDLHDGAQQALIAISIELRMAATSDVDDPALAEAGRELALAIDELRSIAHGLHPAALEDEGLVAALEALAESSSGRVTIEADAIDAVHHDVERAAYRAVATVVESTTGSVTVHLAADDRAVGVTIVTGSGLSNPVVQEIEDRVGAADGVLFIERDRSSGTTLIATLPCGS